ncbi:two-component regulator propeller domain-containing protein [Cytophagales bacterium LB-30]|uniref:Two-component regulator propeller domain-containing protein n=1 Tax=Shiella aurantiaca TaxID=3058365 RepID=A0ABT8F2S4_9BACT|nr:two-component regulator propeller domain-containing protein [Shiella aurantiaca]MDN4164720.1 two-component regulator propeller domain-containing protein [Shiella aurantiaca]
MRLFCQALCGLLLLTLCLQRAQAQSYNFENFTVEQGLSQSQNRVIFQDSRGYLWFGSIEGGISKFDGRKFTVFTEQDGLSSNIVYDIEEDTTGTLWIATSKGISLFDGQTFHALEANSLRNVTIFHLQKDKKGNMWLGTREKGLAIWKDSTLHFMERFPEFYLTSIRAIEFDDKDNFYLGTDNGIITGKASALLSGIPITQKISIPSSDTRVLSLQTYHDTLWIGTDKGVYLWLEQRLMLHPHPALGSMEVRDIDTDKLGNLWIGTYGAGLFLKKGEDFDIFKEENGLINNRIQAIEQDDWGNLWVATFFGVSKFAGREFFHITTRQGLQNNLIWAVEEDTEGGMWIGTNNGLSIYKDQKVINLGPKQGYTANRCWAIRRDAEGNMWLGTDQGVFVCNKGSIRAIPHTLDNAFVTMLYFDKHANKIWAGGQFGLAYIDLNQKPYAIKSFRNIKELAGRNTNSMLADKSGRLWLATEGGGLLIVEADGKEKRLLTKDGLSSDVVNEIVAGKNGDIWLAHSLSGISRLRFTDQKKYTFTKYDIGYEQGLLSTNIYSLLLDDTTLWAGTEKGFFQIAIQNDSAKNVTFYDKEKGFIGIEANHKALLKDSQNKLWWGTIKGVTHFDPSLLWTKESPAKAYIHQIDLYFEPVDWSKHTKQFSDWFHLPQGLALGHRDNHLTFKYGSVEMKEPTKVRYRFRLIGFDRNWSPPMENTEVVYSNIPPGTYTFEVQSSTHDLWNQTPGRFSFTIKEPFYFKAWFMILCGVGILLLIYLYIFLRVGYLKKARTELAEKVKERTHEIEKQKSEIEAQRDEIEAQRDQLGLRSEKLELALEEISKKSDQITSSITYAQRIQEAILPSQEALKSLNVEQFILYKPRDIVSGDFYWTSQSDDKYLVAVVDCTGHGVPGAFMSMIGYSLLNQTVKEKGITDPAVILQEINRGIINALKSDDTDLRNRDGMDMCLCVFDKKEKKVLFAGAKRPLFIVADGQVQEIKGDRHAIGGSTKDYNNTFTLQEIPYTKGTNFYLTTDGYADQFGGKQDKKFMVKRFKNLLKEIAYLPVEEQKKVLTRTMDQWKAGHEQTDDILIWGLQK